MKPDPEIIGFAFPLFNSRVAVNKSYIVQVVGDIVQVPVIVQIGESRPVRIGFHRFEPLRPVVPECIRTCILKGEIVHFGGRATVDHIPVVRNGTVDLRLELGPVLVGHVHGISVGNDQVLVPVVIEIREEGRPAPLGTVNPKHLAHFAVRDYLIPEHPVMHMHHVTQELVLVAVFRIIYEVDIAPAVDGLLFLVHVFGKHVQGEHVGVTVVVDIGHVVPHGGFGLVRHQRGNLVLKGPVALVDVEQVI